MPAHADGTLPTMRVPSTVRTVAEVIGMDAAVRLMQVTGRNDSVYVPAREIPQGHRLLSALSLDEARKLQQHFGGELLPYAKRQGARRKRQAEIRASAIKAMHERGRSSADIAASLGCSVRYVRRVISKGTTSSGWRRRRNENAG